MNRQAINNRRDILLLLLFSPGRMDEVNEPIVGRTRLVKMLYLFRQEALRYFAKGTAINEDNFYEFFPWDFGPFSVQVYDDVTFFILRGFIAFTDAEEEPLPESAQEWEHWAECGAEEADEDSELAVYREQEFFLTDEGVSWVKRELWSMLTEDQTTLLREFKAKLVVAPLRAILEYVYSQYPAMTRRSRIKGKVLGQDSE